MSRRTHSVFCLCSFLSVAGILSCVAVSGWIDKPQCYNLGKDRWRVAHRSGTDGTYEGKLITPALSVFSPNRFSANRMTATDGESITLSLGWTIETDVLIMSGESRSLCKITQGSIHTDGKGVTTIFKEKWRRGR